MVDLVAVLQYIINILYNKGEIQYDTRTSKRTNFINRQFSTRN